MWLTFWVSIGVGVLVAIVERLLHEDFGNADRYIGIGAVWLASGAVHGWQTLVNQPIGYEESCYAIAHDIHGNPIETCGPDYSQPIYGENPDNPLSVPDNVGEIFLGFAVDAASGTVVFLLLLFLLGKKKAPRA